ncbi:uncharacterized protein C8R40DRAFT_1078491 [Lentinula edodes]|uniref:uncharacterized protein n=1 Tax=Lentinula edodes TaxID=5353 RepID=UPI001E8E9AD7|nr:uncharacterized protein C8R40DRAFT_1078491 [Lentinula edodes]KAH7881512.1 hypothetical protein C8R40DRAFT_1078491 [Lentinula edodes]KAJ3921475.1 hypothetical protein F5877DRAFT_76166 [Lentinula edodes]
MENFDDMFDSVKAETLRLLVRDLGQKNVGKRDDMLEFLKNRLFGDVPRTTRSTAAAGTHTNQKVSTARKTLSAPGPTRSGRKRKAEEQQEKELGNDDSVGDEDSAAKRTRMTRASNSKVENVIGHDEDDHMDSISAGPRRGKRRATSPKSSSGLGSQRTSARTRTLTAKAAAVAAGTKRGRGRPSKNIAAPSTQDDLSDADAEGDEDEYVEHAEDEEEPIVERRGRGRPRKGTQIHILDEDEDEYVEEVEEESSAERRTRGRSRKAQKNQMQFADRGENEGVEEPAKRGRGRPRKDQGASASAPVLRTVATSRKSRSPAPISPHASHGPMSTRSRTGHSPAKKMNYLTAPLVKRTYGSGRKGAFRSRGRPLKYTAAARGRKPRSSVSKPSTKTKYIPARSRPKENSDRSSASGSSGGKKYTFDGVELVSRNRGWQGQDAAGATSEAGPSTNVRTTLRGVKNADADVDADGDTDMDLLGGAVKSHEGEAQHRSTPLQMHTPGDVNRPTANFKNDLGREETTSEAPRASVSELPTEPQQPESKEEVHRAASLAPSRHSSSALSSVHSTIVVVPPTASSNAAGDSSSSYFIPPPSSIHVQPQADVDAAAGQKVDQNEQEHPQGLLVQEEENDALKTEGPATQLLGVAIGDILEQDKEETGPIISSSSKSPTEASAVVSTTKEISIYSAAAIATSSTATASHSMPSIVTQDVVDEGSNANLQSADQGSENSVDIDVGNNKLGDLESVDEDDTSIMDPPIGHAIEVVVHTEKFTITDTNTSAANPAMISVDQPQEPRQELETSIPNEFTEVNASGEPSSSASRLPPSAPLPSSAQIQASIASLHSLHSRPAEDDTADNALFESTYIDDYDLETDEGEVLNDNVREGNSTEMEQVLNNQHLT